MSLIEHRSTTFDRSDPVVNEKLATASWADFHRNGLLLAQYGWERLFEDEAAVFPG